jgi:DNA-binding NarL/FixJ family response regulator
MAIDDFVSARDRLLRADGPGRSLDDILREVHAAVAGVAPFDCGAILLTDPDTMLPFGGLVDGLPEDGCVPFWDNELLDPDFNKFTVLAGAQDPVATLFEATDGEIGRSPRVDKVFREFAVVDELRVAFGSGTRCWAVAQLLRTGERTPFAPAEIQAVRDLVPIVARVVGNAVVRRDRAPAASALAVLVVDPDGAIQSSTADARRLLDEFLTEGVDLAIPTPVLAAARRAQRSRTEQAVTLRARGMSGRWFRLHASLLDDDGRVAVVIDAASPADLVPIVLEAHGLTPRESEIVPLLARGLATKQIAAELCISRHTVGDYIKSIYEKCGVTSRGELVAKVFTDYVADGHRAVTSHL